MISFACPGCGKQVFVKDDLSGKKMKCPGCRQVIVIPGRPRWFTNPSAERYLDHQDRPMPILPEGELIAELL